MLRPEELATDKASSFEFIKHALSIYTDYESFALLQPTSPFRDSTHIIEAVKLYQTLENTNVLFLLLEAISHHK